MIYVLEDVPNPTVYVGLVMAEVTDVFVPKVVLVEEVGVPTGSQSTTGLW